LGPGITSDTDLAGLGEALVTALKAQEESRTVARGAAGIAATGAAGGAGAWGATPVGAEVTPSQLRDWLTYPPEWGPSEWGPIPFLPDNDLLVQRMEAQWGPLYRYRGISTTAGGNLLVSGVGLGNVLVGVQPLLGLEGDPMRLLFERDLTPHPQYAAFYKWLQLVGGAIVGGGGGGCRRHRVGTALSAAGCGRGGSQGRQAVGGCAQPWRVVCGRDCMHLPTV
jgi:magnesium chelatase subunit H